MHNFIGHVIKPRALIGQLYPTLLEKSFLKQLGQSERLITNLVWSVNAPGGGICYE